MKVCVTGATGFIGAHVVRALVAEGHEVRAVYRDASRLNRLAGTPCEPVRADVVDAASLVAAVEGVELLFHAAGYVGARPAARVWEVNAVSARLAVEAAAEAGLRRVVLTSSVAAIGPPPWGAIGDESTPYRGQGLELAYGQAKQAGEAMALQAGGELGVEVVVVNPAYVLGAPLAREWADNNSSRIVGHYLRGRLPAIVAGRVNLVDVQDVARGHLLAAESGRPGERYVLGGHNLSWVRVIDRLAELSGVHHPVAVLPRGIAGLTRVADSLSVPLPIAHDAFTGMAQNWSYSSRKASDELGYTARPLDETLLATVDWYRELMATGAFDHESPSILSVSSVGLRTGVGLGMTPLIRAGQRILGRRVFAGVD
jgi:dihydroflavonol-4-reductase